MVELAMRLPRERFDSSFVVLGPQPQPPCDDLLTRLAHRDINAIFLGARSIAQLPAIYQQLNHYLHEQQPDLIQCFLAHANVLGALAARKLAAPLVAGVRVAEQRRNGHRLAQRLTARWTDRYVCVSADVAQYAAKNMRLPQQKIVVIPNGIDVERFASAMPLPPAELGISGDRRLLLFVGRLEREKRPDWLLERMPELFSRLPQHDLVLAGRGPLEKTLRAQAARLGIANRVHFVGWRNDIPRLLAAAEILLLTSSAEGMPNAVLEAMAAARPVVATEVHGVRELLGDDRDQIVPPHDPLAIYGAVERLAANPSLSAAIGLRNRQRATTHFSLDAAAAQYAALYDSLLAAEPSKKSPPSR